MFPKPQLLWAAHNRLPNAAPHEAWGSPLEFRSFPRFQQPRNTEFKLPTGHSSLSAQLQLKVQISIAMSICLGAVCGGVKADGFWEAAMGVDMALTTTTCGASGLDADGVGCSEWTFESKLTNYAEYPPCDGVSISCHLMPGVPPPSPCG